MTLFKRQNYISIRDRRERAALGPGRLNIKHIIMLRKAKFYRHLFLCKNVILNNVFTVFLLHNSECMLKSVWWTRNNAVNYVFNMFEEYVNG